MTMLPNSVYELTLHMYIGDPLMMMASPGDLICLFSHRGTDISMHRSRGSIPPLMARFSLCLV